MQSRQGDIEQLCVDIKASLKLLDDKVCKQSQASGAGSGAVLGAQSVEANRRAKLDNAVLTETPTEKGKKVINVDESDGNEDTIQLGASDHENEVEGQTADKIGIDADGEPNDDMLSWEEYLGQWGSDNVTIVNLDDQKLVQGGYKNYRSSARRKVMLFLVCHGRFICQAFVFNKTVI